MNTADTRPVIVAIEGPDGCGKSTHVRAAVEHLRAGGIAARAFHHPAPPERGLPGERIAQWYAEKRRELLDALAPGDVVIADRWFWSTLALRAAILSGPRRDDVDTMDMRFAAEDEADMMGWLRPAVHLSEALPSVVVNAPRSRAAAGMAAVFLDAPDAVLDARLAGRGEPLCPTRFGMRRFYRNATCIDTSTDEARTLVPRLVAWAVEGLRMGAL